MKASEKLSADSYLTAFSPECRFQRLMARPRLTRSWAPGGSSSCHATSRSRRRCVESPSNGMRDLRTMLVLGGAEGRCLSLWALPERKIYSLRGTILLFGTATLEKKIVCLDRFPFLHEPAVTSRYLFDSPRSLLDGEKGCADPLLLRRLPN